MTQLKRISRGLICAFVLLLSIGNTGNAQSNLEIIQDAANLNFPNNITFTLQASTSEEIERINLDYSTNSRSCVEGVARQEAELKRGNIFTATWLWDFKDTGSLPPGAEVNWLWEVILTSGEILKTDGKNLVIEDQQFEWKQIHDERVQVFWVEGSNAFGRNMLNVAVTSLKKLEDGAGIRSNRTIRITVYPSAESLLEAGLFLPEWTGGLAFPEYSVLMMAIPSDSGDWMDEVIPHELAHLITGELVFNCLGITMPTWLNEGLSVYAEMTESEEDSERVHEALENSALPPLRNLVGGFPADPEKTDLAYSQSGEIVRFLLRTYGSEKMAELISSMQSGLLINPALRKVYGFDTDGLDNAWRDSLGFNSIENQSKTATATPARTAVPTRALWTPISRPTLVPTATIPLFTITPTSMEIAEALMATPTLCPNNLPCEQAAISPSLSPEKALEITSAAAPDSKKNPLAFPCLSGFLPLSGALGLFLFMIIHKNTT